MFENIVFDINQIENTIPPKPVVEVETGFVLIGGIHGNLIPFVPQVTSLAENWFIEQRFNYIEEKYQNFGTEISRFYLVNITHLVVFNFHLNVRDVIKQEVLKPVNFILKHDNMFNVLPKVIYLNAPTLTGIGSLIVYKAPNLNIDTIDVDTYIPFETMSELDYNDLFNQMVEYKTTLESINLSKGYIEDFNIFGDNYPIMNHFAYKYVSLKE
ncbi:hypothetical protein HOY80DRAFT_996138 [Tuber brumale]|nr:hypothetical protein HOY80DRAFT_996138 [Tuber brumale]